MREKDKLPENLQNALSNGLLKRLPITFLPFVNQQLNQWDHLFPNERQSIERLLLYVADLSSEQSADLFRDVVEIEEKMGVRQWEFSTTEQTIQNSSLLARSPYFQDWRRAVQAVYDAADSHALKTSGAAVKPENRLVLLDIPLPLPADAASVWRRWQGIGQPMKLDLGLSSGKASALELLLTGIPNADGGRSGGLLDAARSRSDASSADAWVIDAGRSLVDAALGQESSTTNAAKAILLSNGDWTSTGRAFRTR